MKVNALWIALACAASIAALPACREADNDIGFDDYCFDSDGDGFGLNCGAGSDCNEDDPGLHTTLSIFTDDDGDGVGQTLTVDVCTDGTVPDGYSETAGDCDDEDGGAWNEGVGYVDQDGDGHGIGDLVTVCQGEELPDGFVDESGDCDDNDTAVWVEGLGFTDVDGDGVGVGNAVTLCIGDELPEGFADETGDCDDADGEIGVICDPCQDEDDDGYGAGCELGPDCDDENDAVFQEALIYADLDNDGTTGDGVLLACIGDEPLDGYQLNPNGEDCNDDDNTVFQLLFGFVDSDGDGVGSAESALACSGDNLGEGFAEAPGDCDDSDELVSQTLLGYPDRDGDGAGSGEPQLVCSGDELPETFSPNGNDCDDNDELIIECPDCIDLDEDGYGLGCEAGADCNDEDSTLVMNALLYPDLDGDGYTTSDPEIYCIGLTVPDGFASEPNGIDCNDGDGDIYQELLGYPNGDEDELGAGTPLLVCSGDELADEFAEQGGDCDNNDGDVYQLLVGYVDGDGDHTGAGALQRVCAGDEGLPAGFSEDTGDCDDNDGGVYQVLSGYVNDDGDDYGTGGLLEICSGEDLPDGFIDRAGDCDDGDGSVYQDLAGYVNNDSDDYGTGDLLEVCSGDELPEGFSDQPGDCDDSDGNVFQELPGYVNTDGDELGTGGLLAVCSGDDLPEGFSAEPGDCDDGDGSLYQNLAGYVDHDTDDYGTGSLIDICSGDDFPEGFTGAPGDCDDNDGERHQLLPGYANNDTDDYGTGGLLQVCSGDEGLPEGFASQPGDCNDNDAEVYELLPGYANNDTDDVGAGELLQVCSGDGLPDGFAEGGGDCNDNDGDVWELLPGYVNNDADDVGTGELLQVCSGEGLPDGYAGENGDCNDNNGDLFQNRPGYVDNDGDHLGVGDLLQVCSGADGLPEGYAPSPGDCNDNAEALVENKPAYVDGDLDSVGAGIQVTVCSPAEGLPEGYSTSSSDCNDSNIDIWQLVDLYPDTDSDTYGGAMETLCIGDEPPEPYIARGGDCNDDDRDIWDTCDTCVDPDGDDWFTECNAYQDHLGPDCRPDHGDAWDWMDVLRDWDGDGFAGSQRAVICTGDSAPAGYLDASDIDETDCDDHNRDAWSYVDVAVDVDGDMYVSSETTICAGDSLPPTFILAELGEGPDCHDGNDSQFMLMTVYPDRDDDGQTSDEGIEMCVGESLPTGYFEEPTADTDCNDWDDWVFVGAKDVPGDGIDADCVDGDPMPTAEDGVFVSAISERGGNGTPELPYQSIEFALEAHPEPVVTLYVAEGEYDEPSVTWADQQVYGGFNPDFSSQTGLSIVSIGSIQEPERWFVREDSAVHFANLSLRADNTVVHVDGDLRGDNLFLGSGNEDQLVISAGGAGSILLHDSTVNIDGGGTAVFSKSLGLVKLVDCFIRGSSNSELTGVQAITVDLFNSNISLLGNSDATGVFSDDLSMVGTDITIESLGELQKAEGIRGLGGSDGFFALEEVTIDLLRAGNGEIEGIWADLDMRLTDVTVAATARDGNVFSAVHSHDLRAEGLEVLVGGEDEDSMFIWTAPVTVQGDLWMAHSTIGSFFSAFAEGTIDATGGDVFVYGSAIELTPSDEMESWGLTIRGEFAEIYESQFTGSDLPSFGLAIGMDGRELTALFNSFTLSQGDDSLYAVDVTDDVGFEKGTFLYNWVNLRDDEGDSNCYAFDIDSQGDGVDTQIVVEHNQFRLGCSGDNTALDVGEEASATIRANHSLSLDVAGISEGICPVGEPCNPWGKFDLFEFDGYNDMRVVGNYANLANSHSSIQFVNLSDERQGEWVDGVIANNAFMGQSTGDTDAIEVEGDVLVSNNSVHISDGGSLELVEISGGTVDVIANRLSFDQATGAVDMIEIRAGRVLVQDNWIWAGTAASGEMSGIDLENPATHLAVLNNTIFTGNFGSGEDQGSAVIEFETGEEPGSEPPSALVAANNIFLLGTSQDRSVPAVLVLTAGDGEPTEQPIFIFQNNLIDTPGDYVFVKDDTSDVPLLVQSLVGFEGCLWRACSAVQNTLLEDPGFDPEVDDQLVLAWNSAAIDAGIPLNQVAGDDTVVRWWGGDHGYGDAPDIGAFEWMLGEFEFDLDPPATEPED